MSDHKGRIKDEDVNAVRERSNIVDVVSDYVALKKKGRLFWGLCPFHQEKTASFKVDPAAQLFHCFGCGEGGNVFSFVMKVEHLEFPEAVGLLADRVGYELHYDTKSAPESLKKSRILEANRFASMFYQYILLKTNEGSRGRLYLKKRGLNDDVVKRYGLGLAPQAWSSVGNYLAKKGFSQAELVEAGLVIKGSKGYYDRFRARLIFPITDIRGRVIAFGGRIIDSGEPKYLNSPETPVYHKSSTLYGLHVAKNEIVRLGTVLVVEGYTDVIALAQAGISNVVATLGTAFTAEHMKLLKRFAERVILVFDADTAGIKAAESVGSYLSEFRLPKMEALRDLEEGSASGIDVRVVILPHKQDPADYIGSHSADSFRKLVDDAEPFFDFYLTREVDKYNISEIRQKEQAAVAGFKLIATLEHPASQKAYLSKIAQRLGLDEEALTVKFNAMFKRGAAVRSEAKETLLDPQEKTERIILHLALKYPEIRGKIPEEIDESYFVFPAHARLFTVLKDIGGGTFDAGVLVNIDRRLGAKATELFMIELGYEEENLSKYFEDILISLKDFHYTRQINKLKQELQFSMLKKDEAEHGAFEELMALEAKRRDLRQKGPVV
ncbi:MAG: DNA primase [Candidatus Aquicultor secundus]|uniref:DNA primase n=1 Tax=Candidatus Aquicultor secundus TaxID=1973895 RepID=A0A2M7T9R2_9ACTN|nr:DNA primase [Candidatus Aquicultor secundus]NCO65484.1 DNA primase [Solirubrobacter sp.]OIO83861.1 MAG: DNA primase [Candidatus Aquicultor secundus]PIU26840.1 MAG: DNA primase [Candidatus Aquicultor secundus]PIW22320.1 MAG: DNA primase [Candidatus Aquicultor secundus]PIX52993.1 MAG: DNA primase [Candidatus Aquicultor secundus]